MLAAIIQANSACADGPFVKVNVGALPKELMESELFGAEAGAYTGATKVRQGRFEAADGGTLFLDEIGNLSLDGQAKLLRVLQTGEFERLGRSVDASCEGARTERDQLRTCPRRSRGTLPRGSLLPAERDRAEGSPLSAAPDDILPLARHFLDPGFSLDDSAERALLAHPWPGNIRELMNTIRRASLLATDTEIRAADLGLARRRTLDDAQPEREPDAPEIEHALERARGIIAHAARELGLSRQALYRRMEKLGIRDKSG